MTNLTRIMNISKNSSLLNFADEGLLMPENFNVQEEEEGGKFLSKRSLQKRYVTFLAPTGAQGVKMCVRASVRASGTFLKITLQMSF